MKKSIHRIKYLPRILFNLLLSISASVYVVVIYLIKEEIVFTFFPTRIAYLSYIFYLVAPVVIAYICLCLSNYLPKCDMACPIVEVELASHSFLPNYLGYFFVALSIPNLTALSCVYAVILIFTYLSQALCFNPFFLLFKYQFYFVTGEDGKKIFLITKQKMKQYSDIVLDNLRRVNDFTFIDMG